MNKKSKKQRIWMVIGFLFISLGSMFTILAIGMEDFSEAGIYHILGI